MLVCLCLWDCIYDGDLGGDKEEDDVCVCVFVFCSVLFSKPFFFSFWKFIGYPEGAEEEDEVAAAGGKRLPNSAGVQVVQVICQ